MTSDGRGNYLGVDAALDHDGEPDWDTVMESRAESERDARTCPWCGVPADTVFCDGCKFDICRECNYPCACGRDGDEEELF